VAGRFRFRLAFVKLTKLTDQPASVVIVTVRHDWADVDQTYVSVFTWLVGSKHLPSAPRRGALHADRRQGVSDTIVQ
jgi:hypothetical protein